MGKILKYGSVLLLAFCFSFFSSCNKDDKNADRNEYIKVYMSSDSEYSVEEAWLPCAGGSTTIYVRSNVSFEVKWQDGKIPAWASVSKPQSLGGDLYSVKIEYTPLSQRQPDVIARGLYERRDGVLMLTNSGLYLGRYFVLHQGLTKRMGTDFSWLSDGYDIPNKTIGETLYEDWTSSQKAYGYSSTCFEGQNSAWCYSKKGYVRLGNEEGMGADFLMPTSSSFANDSLLVLSFAAVAQVGASTGDFTGNTDDVITPEDEPVGPGEGGGTEPITPMSAPSGRGPRTDNSSDRDASKLKVEVIGGGFIRTAGGGKPTSIELEVGYYNPSSPKFPSDIFDSQRYLIFIEGDKTNPLTNGTFVRFEIGDVTGKSKVPNRIFLDDLYIYRMLMNYKKNEWSPRMDMDEDLYQLNHCVSGRDSVLGGARNE